MSLPFSSSSSSGRRKRRRKSKKRRRRSRGRGEGGGENCHHHASFSLPTFLSFIDTALSFEELKLLVGLRQNIRELKRKG